MLQAPHQCEMTYMWPRYEPVDMGARSNSSRYRLLLYRDDAIAAHAPGAAR